MRPEVPPPPPEFPPNTCTPPPLFRPPLPSSPILQAPTRRAVPGVYEIPVMLQNASNLLRRVRVLPPSTKFFSITLLSYPSEEGNLAPGMHATLHVRFAPDSLADYDDFLVVQVRPQPPPSPERARPSPECSLRRPPAPPCSPPPSSSGIARSPS